MNNLTDFEAKKLKNDLKKMCNVLSLAYANKTDVFIGFYALQSAQVFNNFALDSIDNKAEFYRIRKCLINMLSEYQKQLFQKEFKGDL